MLALAVREIIVDLLLMNARWLFALAVLCGVALGFVLGKTWGTGGKPNRQVAGDAPANSNALGAPIFKSPPSRTGTNVYYAPDLAALLRAARNNYWKVRDIARSIPITEATNALQIARAILAYQEFGNFRHALLESWGERDPHSLLAYGLSLKSRNDRNGAVSAALRELGRTDPDRAMEFIQNLPPGQDRQQFWSAALQGLAQTNPEAAMEKLNSARPYERRWIRDQIITQMAEKDPKGAAELALQYDRSSRYGGMEGKLGSVLQVWMRQDPDAAVGWLQSQPEATLRKRSVTQAIQNLGHQDAGAAIHLLEHLPPSQGRDDALNNILNTWGGQDLDALKTWVDSRTDKHERTSGLLAYANGLASTDPAAAAAALHGVKPDERQSWQFREVFTQYANEIRRRRWPWPTRSPIPPRANMPSGAQSWGGGRSIPRPRQIMPLDFRAVLPATRPSHAWPNDGWKTIHKPLLSG